VDKKSYHFGGISNIKLRVNRKEEGFAARAFGEGIKKLPTGDLYRQEYNLIIKNR